MSEEYQAKNWLNYTNTTTPITAGDLNRIDSGVGDLMTRVANLEQSGGGGGSVTCTGASASTVTNAKNEILESIDEIISDLAPIKENLSILAESSVNSGIVQHGFINLNDYGIVIIPDFDMSNCTSFEYCACVKFLTAPSPYSGGGYALFGSLSTFYALPSLEITQNGIFAGISSNGTSWTFRKNWAINWADFLNQFLFLKFKYADGKAAIYSSTDGVNFTARTTPTTCDPPIVGSDSADYRKLVLGCVANSTDHTFTVFGANEGLNIFNSYVKLNGDLVWGRQIAGEITE